MKWFLPILVVTLVSMKVQGRTDTKTHSKTHESKGGRPNLIRIQDEVNQRFMKETEDLDEKQIRLDARFPLTKNDFARGKHLKREDIIPPNGGRALYSSGYYEGDIVGPLTGRNAIKDMSFLWPNGRIPYVMSQRYSPRDRAVLAASMQTYHDKTCIRFVPKNESDLNYIYIYPGNGCASQVGKGGWMQFVSLGAGCLFVGIAQHELMHVVGFWHEQSRFDRDDFIRILWENIEQGMEYNFEKYSWDDIQSLGAPYDYGSVMHYGTNAFARSFGPTIQTKDGSSKIMGQRYGLSDIDLYKINKLYQCPGHKTSWP